MLRNLVLRLNYKQDWNLGGLNARNMVQRLQHSILIPHRAMSNKRKKGPEAHKKEGKICDIKLLEDNFSLEGTIKWLRKGGGEIKVHFTFFVDRFASARPLNLLIMYSIS